MYLQENPSWYNRSVLVLLLSWYIPLKELKSEADGGTEDHSVLKFPREKDEGKLTECIKFTFRVEMSE